MKKARAAAILALLIAGLDKPALARQFTVTTTVQFMGQSAGKGAAVGTSLVYERFDPYTHESEGLFSDAGSCTTDSSSQCSSAFTIPDDAVPSGTVAVTFRLMPQQKFWSAAGLTADSAAVVVAY